MMTVAAAILSVTVFTGGELVQAPPQDVRGAEDLSCRKLREIEITDEKGETIEVRSSTEIPVDSKYVAIHKSTVSIQAAKHDAKPLLVYLISSETKLALRAFKENSTSIGALALDRTTGRMVLSTTMAGDKSWPGTKAHIAYFQCAKFPP